MDDFGSGYSSLDVLQDIHFDLLKFDMRFMQRFEEGEESRIILTELVRMAGGLGIDTVCEGVETAEQASFLREIGCAKLQGFYYCKPITFDEIVERNRKGIQIGFENPEESDYYAAIGRVNLYDLGVIADEDKDTLRQFFKTLPVGVLEITDDKVCFIRTNQAYRDYMKRFFGYDLAVRASDYPARPSGSSADFMDMVRQCCTDGNRAFYDGEMSDGTGVHVFVKKIGTNPVTGADAVAVAVLSMIEADEERI
jgi:FOG: EAL domain